MDERAARVPPKARPDADALPRGELDAMGALDPAWPGRPAWECLLDLVGGHPRSIHLIAGQVRLHREPSPVLARLRKEHLHVVDASLAGSTHALADQCRHERVLW